MKSIRLLPILLLACCELAAQTPQRLSREQYIDLYRDMAIRERDLYGIPAAITMAQGLFESDNGNSRLATLANNHFGIKCRNDWDGATIRHDDDALQECFRSYDNAELSYRDHSEFLKNSPRYGALFNLPVTDYQGWAYGLKAAGYATNPQYATRLIDLIEQYELYRLDAPAEELLAAAEPVRPERSVIAAVTDATAEPERVDIDNYEVSLRIHEGYAIYPNNGSDFILSREGDTWAGLAHKFGVSARKLRAFNDAPASAPLLAGEMVYVRAKAKRANNGKLIHLAEPGETLRAVSQKYGVRLRSLASINLRQPDAVLGEGQQIRLR